MAGMDFYKEKKLNVTRELTDGVDAITHIGDEFQEVKDQLADMPGGLDADLVEMIKEAEEAGRAEASADIEATKSSLVDQAKATADTIRSDVQTKISENNAAKGKLEGISSKYGKGAIDRAKTAITDNTKMGEDLISQLENAVREADQNVQRVKDKL